MLELSGTERDTLAEALRTTRVRRHWVRLRALWLAGEGRPVPEIAHELGAGASSVFAWVAQWRPTHDPAALADAPRDAPRSGRHPVLDAALRDQLEALLAVPPEVHGYHTTGWTVPLLQRHYTEVLREPVRGTTLRRVLHALGYRWKRPRYVLARRDPACGEAAGGEKRCTSRRRWSRRDPRRTRWCCVRTRPSCASSRRCARAGASAVPPSRGR